MPSGERDTTPMLHQSNREIELRAAPRRSSSISWASTSSEIVPQEPIFYTQQIRRSAVPELETPSSSGLLYGGAHRGRAAPPSLADEAGGQTEGNNEHLLRSGQFGMCNDPYCNVCPGSYQSQVFSRINENHQGSSSSQKETEGAKQGKNWLQFLSPNFVLNPHSKFVRHWNKFFVISCLIAIFIDPLFFFVLSVDEDKKCIIYWKTFAIRIAVVRSITDFFYLIHICIQFKLAYVAPDSRVVGTGDWVDDPKRIAWHYLRGYFFLDLLVVLPLPQVMILGVLPDYLGASSANYAKNWLRATILLQYVPRIIRVLPLISGGSSSRFIFESAWSNFIINILMFVLAGHVVGSCWYLFGLQQVNKCLRDSCINSNITRLRCRRFLVCKEAKKFNGWKEWEGWKRNANATSCLSSHSQFNYGIYGQAPNITKKRSITDRYVYSLFWGFQQISTLAGNQVPSDFVWEVLFTMSIIGLGLLLFALLIGNMQIFLQSLGKRRLDMQLRRRDFELWMKHRRVPLELKRKIRQSERFTWSATRGINEEQLMENLPENLQKEIRCHLFAFLNKARIFSLMDEPILDAFRQVLTQKLYLGMSIVQESGSPIEKMIFIVRGQMESIGTDRIILGEGDVCGEELLAWHLEAITIRKNKDEDKNQRSKMRLFSQREVRCLTNVEAFVLLSSDLEDVTAKFERFLQKPSVRGAIRYESPYWRSKAVTHIQIVWRYKRWHRMRRVNNRRRHHHPPRR